MSVFEITGRCYQKVTNEYPECLSYLQLCALHVAAHYKLRRNSMGWFADGYVRADGAVIMHSPDTIRLLLKLRLLEGTLAAKTLPRELGLEIQQWTRLFPCCGRMRWKKGCWTKLPLKPV